MATIDDVPCLLLKGMARLGDAFQGFPVTLILASTFLLSLVAQRGLKRSESCWSFREVARGGDPRHFMFVYVVNNPLALVGFQLIP